MFLTRSGRMAQVEMVSPAMRARVRFKEIAAVSVDLTSANTSALLSLKPNLSLAFCSAQVALTAH